MLRPLEQFGLGCAGVSSPHTDRSCIDLEIPGRGKKERPNHIVTVILPELFEEMVAQAPAQSGFFIR